MLLAPREGEVDNDIYTTRDLVSASRTLVDRVIREPTETPEEKSTSIGASEKTKRFHESCSHCA